MSSGVTNFIARMVYIKEAQHGFQTDEAELKNLTVRGEIRVF